MKKINTTYSIRSRWLGISLTGLGIAVLSACANYSGIHSDQHMKPILDYASSQSIPMGSGQWPKSDWAYQFGDAQLKLLLSEALRDSPTLAQAQARLAAASAYRAAARSDTMPNIGTDYSLHREQLTANSVVPQPYGGSWQTENNLSATAFYDLDLWGKNRESLKEAISEEQASAADAEVIGLALTTSITRAYNQLDLLFRLRDVALEESTKRDKITRISNGRNVSGLDTVVEVKTAEGNVASIHGTVAALNGQILNTRYQLAALIGAGPDRGLNIRRPTSYRLQAINLPENLPADLIARRPDITAARLRVDAMTHGVKVAKADFYPDINLSAAIGLDSFGFGHFLTSASRTASVGPAVHLPIFDAGALRAQLKGKYADFDYAVATYNQTLVNALSEVAKQLGDMHSTEIQLIDARHAQEAAKIADQVALAQYRSGLTNQLTVLNADMNLLAAEQNIIGLTMSARDQQIVLGSALGGGFKATTSSR